MQAQMGFIRTSKCLGFSPGPVSKPPITVGHQEWQQGREGPEHDGRQESSDPSGQPEAARQQRHDGVRLGHQVLRSSQEESDEELGKGEKMFLFKSSS